MICKKDVIVWFKELESYKRIDMMCTLLSMCLPFELRFLGTCLEEMSRKDSQELRGIELRVNSPQDLTADMIACQKGEPTDKKIRRKMALYLALIRACNRSCVVEIFRTLEGWGEREFYKMDDFDTLQELLLVYTMAANHPVFSLEEHMYCSDIFDKIHENKLLHDHKKPLHKCMKLHRFTEKTTNDFVQNKISDLGYHIAPTQQDIMSQELNIRSIHIGGQHQQIQTVPVPRLAQGALTVTLPNSHITKPASASPILSQQSSPCSSRATSPDNKKCSSAKAVMQKTVHPKQQAANTHLQNIPHQISVSLKSVRSPSAEIVHPALVRPHPLISSEIILPQGIKQLDEMIINTDGSMTQLQSLIRNGFGRNASHHKQKTANFLSHYHQQLPTNQHFPAVPSENFALNTGFAYSMQNLSFTNEPHSLNDSIVEQHQYKCTRSDSGSSVGSYGETSPPETPTLFTNISSGQATIRMKDQVYQCQQNQKHLDYSNKQIRELESRRTERLEKNLVTTSEIGTSSGTLIFSPSNENLKTTSLQHQYLGTDIILAEASLSNAACIVQSSIATNNIANNATTDGAPVTNTSSPNNNIVNAIFINSPATTGNCGILSNVITSHHNNVVQQQYNPSFTYNGPVARHVTTPVIAYNPRISSMQSSSFRMQSFPIPSNAEIMYPAYHPLGFAFLSGGISAANSGITLRTSSTSANQTGTINQHGNDLQQQHQHILSMNIAQNPSAYMSPCKGSDKPISCYNCGSQTHSGRECEETSMDDVCRNAINKLDYSVYSSIESPAKRPYPTPNISQVAVSTSTVTSENAIASSIHTIQKQHFVDKGKTSTT